MKILIKIVLYTISSTLIILNFLYADTSKDVAIILKSKGSVKIRSANPGKWRNIYRGMHLNSGDIIKTGDNAIVAIMFTDDKSLLKVRENSTLAIKGKRQKSFISKRIKCTIGQLWIKVKGQKSKFLVETPSGIAAVKGTEFYSIIDQNGNTTIIGIEGILSLMNKFGEILIKAGETGFASKFKAPTVNKTDSSQIPDWGKEDTEENKLEFEFEDSEGNKKIIRINYLNK